ncbi:MAG: hypothetical protein SNJ71_08635, partial [Bacteroidales bacterium]
MNKFLKLNLLLLVSLYSYSQDYIITKTNDTISCQVIKIKENFVYYKTISALTSKKGVINSNEIKSIEYGKKDIKYKRFAWIKDSTKFHINIGIGYMKNTCP